MQLHPEIMINRAYDPQGSRPIQTTGLRSLNMMYSQQLNQHHETKDASMSKILIVADDVDSCTTFTGILEEAGHSVKMLRSSAEVFRVLPRFIPKVVLVDMNVPGVSNILTLSFIRRLSELRQTKIIVVTHRSQIVESAKSIFRAEVILTKPVSPERLLEAVSSCLSD